MTKNILPNIRGESLNQIARRASAAAIERETDITFIYSATSVTVHPGDSPEAIAKAYWNENSRQTAKRVREHRNQKILCNCERQLSEAS